MHNFTIVALESLSADLGIALLGQQHQLTASDIATLAGSLGSPMLGFPAFGRVKMGSIVKSPSVTASGVQPDIGVGVEQPSVSAVGG